MQRGFMMMVLFDHLRKNHGDVGRAQHIDRAAKTYIGHVSDSFRSILQIIEGWFQIDQNQGKIMAELKLHTWAFTMR